MKAHEGTSFAHASYDGAVVVAVHGDLDVISAPAFRTALQRAVEAGRSLVVVDLADVSNLDSSGLAVVFGEQRLLPASQRMMLANVTDRMSRMLRLAGSRRSSTCTPRGSRNRGSTRSDLSGFTVR